jgi:hypothetical protein
MAMRGFAASRVLAGLILTLPAGMSAGAPTGVPSGSNSTLPAAAYVCPAGDLAIPIVVRDGANQPVPRSVVILSAVQELRGCSPDDGRWVTETDAQGEAGFFLAAGRLSSNVAFDVTADGVPLGTIPWTFATDQDDDFDVDDADVEIAAAAESLYGAGRSDFNGNGVTDAEDLELLRSHLGHACASPPPPHPPADPAGGTWSRLRPGGEVSGRTFHSAVFDPRGDRIVVMGGANQNRWPAVLNDVWELSLFPPTTWKELRPSGSAPEPRVGHSAVLDDSRGRMVLFGGAGGCIHGCVGNDSWARDLSGDPQWKRLRPAGNPPGARYGHAALYDPARDRMIVLGGLTLVCAPPWGCREEPMSDVWELRFRDSVAWRPLEPAGATFPSGRLLAVHDRRGDRLVVYQPGSASTFELSLGEPPVWSLLATATRPPSSSGARAGMVLDPIRGRALLMVDGEVFALSLDDDPLNWVRLDPAGGPIPLVPGAALAYDSIGDRIVVFGGELYNPVDGTYEYPTAVRAMGFSSPPREVAVDLRPGSLQDAEFLGIHGDAVLLVFGNPEFDVHGIDAHSVRLAGACAKLDGNGQESIAFTDLDLDGYDDALLPFAIEDLRTMTPDHEMIIHGRTIEGQVFVGRDRIRVTAATPRGSPPSPARVALHRAWGSAGGVRVSCTVQVGASATLELYDVGGRRLAAARLEAERRHEVMLVADRPFGSGLYFVRLSQGRSFAIGRAVVLR